MFPAPTGGKTATVAPATALDKSDRVRELTAAAALSAIAVERPPIGIGNGAGRAAPALRPTVGTCGGAATALANRAAPIEDPIDVADIGDIGASAASATAASMMELDASPVKVPVESNASAPAAVAALADVMVNGGEELSVVLALATSERERLRRTAARASAATANSAAPPPTGAAASNCAKTTDCAMLDPRAAGSVTVVGSIREIAETIKFDKGVRSVSL